MLDMMLVHTTLYGGSIGINPRGHHVMEYLVNTNLNILIKGNKPTFHVSNKQEVTALTLRTDNIGGPSVQLACI